MMNGINGVQMTGRMMIGLGKNMIGIMSGLVLLMIRLVTGLGLKDWSWNNSGMVESH